MSTFVFTGLDAVASENHSLNSLHSLCTAYLMGTLLFPDSEQEEMLKRGVKDLYAFRCPRTIPSPLHSAWTSRTIWQSLWRSPFLLYDCSTFPFKRAETLLFTRDSEPIRGRCEAVAFQAALCCSSISLKPGFRVDKGQLSVVITVSKRQDLFIQIM